MIDEQSIPSIPIPNDTQEIVHSIKHNLIRALTEYVNNTQISISPGSLFELEKAGIDSHQCISRVIIEQFLYELYKSSELFKNAMLKSVTADQQLVVLPREQYVWLSSKS